jgi:isoamylase
VVSRDRHLAPGPKGANQVASPGSEALIGGEWTVYGMQGRSLLVLIAK